MLSWAVSCPPQLDAQDHDSIAELERMIDALRNLPTRNLEEVYLPRELFRTVEAARALAGLEDNSVRFTEVPAIEKYDDAVLMFGGVNPDISASDAGELMELLASRRGGNDGDALSPLVNTTIGAPLSAPFEEGYELAEELLEELEMPGEATSVDIKAIVERLGISVVTRTLRTSTIRGVAVAGDGYGPAILLNMQSSYNSTPPGRRFTLAHELFHILYDREHARRVAHASGPWAAPGIEKRANAFAAMLLMPHDLVHRSMSNETIDLNGLFRASELMDVGPSALLEHLYNTGMIDEIHREELRAALIASTSASPR
jgi:Zn-dependent peptidase ImmA (M78 family)